MTRLRRLRTPMKVRGIQRLRWWNRIGNGSIISRLRQGWEGHVKRGRVTLPDKDTQSSVEFREYRPENWLVIRYRLVLANCSSSNTSFTVKIINPRIANGKGSQQ